jgi:Spy/CpxP family protein refolding chaperone
MRLLYSLALGALMFVTTPVFAQVTPTVVEPIAQTQVSIDPALKVTAEQREKLMNLRNQYILSTAQKKAELTVAKNQLRTVFKQPTIDKQAALSLQTKINGLKGDLSTARLNLKLAAADVFTAEQRAAFSKMHHGYGHKRGCGPTRGHGFRGHGSPAGHKFPGAKA